MMRMGLNMACDCSELKGRPLDWCTGKGHDGRPDPVPAAVEHWKNTNCGKKIQKSTSFWSRAVNFASSAAKHIMAGRPKATPEQIQDRLEICRACDKFENNRCQICGCSCNGSKDFMNKLAWADQECPHPDGPKWKAIESQGESGPS